jgi:hypothetical protein
VTLLVWTFVLAILAVPSLSLRTTTPGAGGFWQRHAQLVAAHDVTIAPAAIAPLLANPALLAAFTSLPPPPSLGLAPTAPRLDHPRTSRTPVYLRQLALLL